MGFFILREAIPLKWCKKQKQLFKRRVQNGEIKEKPYHPTMVQHINENQMIREIGKIDLTMISKPIYKFGTGINFTRFLRKDKSHTKGVQLHQDICYQQGGFEKFSIFISLTKNTIKNGSIILYPLTHNFGYLGDAGQIREYFTKKLLESRNQYAARRYNNYALIIMA